MTYGESHRSSNNKAIGNRTKIYEDHAFCEYLEQEYKKLIKRGVIIKCYWACKIVRNAI